MKKLLIFSIVLMTAGCSFTSRLDALNDQILQMSSKLDETNRLLTSVEKTTSRLTKVLPGINNDKPSVNSDDSKNKDATAAIP